MNGFNPKFNMEVWQFRISKRSAPRSIVEACNVIWKDCLISNWWYPKEQPTNWFIFWKTELATSSRQNLRQTRDTTCDVEFCRRQRNSAVTGREYTAKSNGRMRLENTGRPGKYGKYGENTGKYGTSGKYGKIRDVREILTNGSLIGIYLKLCLAKLA